MSIDVLSDNAGGTWLIGGGAEHTQSGRS